MTLTTDDLQAIKIIVDEGIEDSKRHTAAGFAEVHEKIDSLREDLDTVKEDLSSVKQTVDLIARVQRAEIERVDHQGTAINKIRKAMKAV